MSNPSHDKILHDLNKLLYAYLDEPKVKRSDTPYIIAMLHNIASGNTDNECPAHDVIAEAAIRLDALYGECLRCHSIIDNLKAQTKT